MDSQKKTHDEQMFHRLELGCREVEEGFWDSIPSRLYRLVSDYGWSFMRPASFLFFFTCLGYLYFMERLGRLCLGWRVPICGGSEQALGVDVDGHAHIGGWFELARPRAYRRLQGRPLRPFDQ